MPKNSLLVLAVAILAAALAVCVRLIIKNRRIPAPADSSAIGTDTAAKAEAEAASASSELEGAFKKHHLEYERLDTGLSAQQFLDLYLAEAEKGRAEGYTPVFISTSSPANIVFMLGEYDTDELLASELPDGKALIDKYIRDAFDPELDISDPEELRDDAAVGETIKRFSSLEASPFTGRVWDVYLVKAPAAEPWKAVLYIPFGGWNNCPEPLEMAAICKYWYEKFGAAPAVITGDELEFYLPSPVPAEEAWQTAIEHFAFCEDRLFQCTNTGTLSEIEDSIKRSNIWFFWWD
ncbi:MAG: DUF4253 domain-containing protein [Clostridia bacterium]|nr:DUF4253 domain-containing protein [Clostridia bacterium]